MKVCVSFSVCFMGVQWNSTAFMTDFFFLLYMIVVYGTTVSNGHIIRRYLLRRFQKISGWYVYLSNSISFLAKRYLHFEEKIETKQDEAARIQQDEGQCVWCLLTFMCKSLEAQFKTIPIMGLMFTDKLCQQALLSRAMLLLLKNLQLTRLMIFYYFSENIFGKHFWKL